MLRIALVASAISITMGTAFAGSDHFGNGTGDQAPVAIDHAATASVTAARPYNTIDTTTKTGAAAKIMTAPDKEPGQGIWGN